MIRGIHGMLLSSEPEALRAFLRDKLRLPFSDIGGGWLIFDFAEGDLGVHPADAGDAGGHDVSFYVDDLEATVFELEGRGVTFDSEIAEHSYGFVTYLTMPGGVKVQLYQPKYRKKKPAARSQAKKPKQPAKKARVAKRKPAARKSKPAARKRKRR
jgi:hypothetical protein